MACSLWVNAHLVRGGAAAELEIVIDHRDTIPVVDVFDFDADGRMAAIRAYIGRGDDDRGG